MSIYRLIVRLIMLAIVLMSIELLQQSFRVHHSVQKSSSSLSAEPWSSSPSNAPGQNLVDQAQMAISRRRVVVIPRMEDEDVSWIEQELPNVNVTVYVVNNFSVSKHPPKNKGHEVMIYLTYIIDNYDRLPEIVIFMHAHRWTHHNNALLKYDASLMIQRLSNAYVIQQGYVNMRCHWSPGCPEWLHPNSDTHSVGKQEEAVLRQSWSELFPSHEIPKTLSQACCAQFAVSRERIQFYPLNQFIFYRDWILRTPLSDYISGRIWEYTWQFALKDLEISCPDEDACYCDAFGVCFGGKQSYNIFMEQWRKRERLEKELRSIESEAAFQRQAVERNGSSPTSAILSISTHLHQIQYEIEALTNEIDAKIQIALDRGTSASKGA